MTCFGPEAPGMENRESGESPERSGHCKQRADPQIAIVQNGMRRRGGAVRREQRSCTVWFCLAGAVSQETCWNQSHDASGESKSEDANTEIQDHDLSLFSCVFRGALFLSGGRAFLFVRG